jgi:hypothetical protein
MIFAVRLGSIQVLMLMKRSLRHMALLGGVLALMPSVSIGAAASIQLESLDQLTASPARYSGKRVQVDACLFVSRHGMALDNCNWQPGGGSQLVLFEPLGDNDMAYRRLLEAGFSSKRKEIVVATISGDFIFDATKKRTFILKISDVKNIRTIRDPAL